MSLLRSTLTCTTLCRPPRAQVCASACLFCGHFSQQSGRSAHGPGRDRCSSWWSHPHRTQHAPRRRLPPQHSPRPGFQVARSAWSCGLGRRRTKGSSLGQAVQGWGRGVCGSERRCAQAFPAVAWKYQGLGLAGPPHALGSDLRVCWLHDEGHEVGGFRYLHQASGVGGCLLGVSA